MTGARDASTDGDLLVIAGRYQVVRQLGRGGMAAVYEVDDTVIGKSLALKRLAHRGLDDAADLITEMFEREFVTMSRLSHPRIAAVHDYGHDGSQPFFTMELLDGGDLQQLCPLPWRQACRLLMDVCSALSLLHSRRQVHRDVTPRNVRCTRDGQAKLFDLGAMAPFGPTRRIVGSAPFTAPETLAAQSLDGRADLYALGATAYRALTGKYAYAARSFDDLREAFRHPPAPPSHYATDVPESLDRLVMSMLQLSPMARPFSAAEVMERLSAIADLPLDEAIVVHQAYLNTPDLVGHDAARSRARRAVARVREGRGGGLLIEGAPGTGRSRLLDSCVLEAKLLDVRVARADAGDASGAPWGVVRALADQLLIAYGDAAVAALEPHTSVLCEVLPALEARLCGRGVSVVARTFETPQEQRVATFEAFTGWVVALGRQHPLALALDDFDRMDEPSAALLASIALATRREPVTTFASCEHAQPADLTPAVRLLLNAARVITLGNLTRQQTEDLLASVFGDAPNVRLVSDRLFCVTHGNPRDVMAMAQHLLDRRLVRYEGGAWHLPAQVEISDLPASMEDALATPLERLPERCRLLATASALASLESMTHERCLALGLHSTRADLLVDLQVLTSRGILVERDRHYTFTQPVIRRLLAARVEPDTAQGLHRRLADLFKADGKELFRVATHALFAGQTERAIAAMRVYGDVVISQVPDMMAGFERVRSLPVGWYDTELAVLEAASHSQHDRATMLALHACLVYDGGLSGRSAVASLEYLIREAHRECGLDIYASLGDDMEEGARLFRALSLAQQRHEADPASMRGVSPAEAIPLLAQLVVAAIGVAARGNDLPLLERVPALGPLTVLDPALALVDLNRQASLKVLAGQVRDARAFYRRILDDLDQGDREGRDQSRLLYMRLGVQYAMGVIELSLGSADTERWASLIEGNPSFVVNASRLRMLAALRQGNWDLAAQHRDELERMRIRNAPPQVFEGAHQFPELLALIDAEDLVRVKQLIPSLVTLAEELPSWKPILGLAQAAYHLLRGDARHALDELDNQLLTVRPARHIAWASLMNAKLTCLRRLGQFSEAIEVARAALKASREHDLYLGEVYALESLGLSLAANDAHAEARGYLGEAITLLERHGATGVLLGIGHEACARAALLAGDIAAFERASSRCAEQYRAGHNPILTAKYERLMQLAHARHVRVSKELADAALYSTRATSNASLDSLSTSRAADDRARSVLEILAHEFRCSHGFLYALRPSGPTLCARFGSPSPPSDLEDWVRQRIDDLYSSDDPETEIATAAAVDPLPSNAQSSEPLMPVVLVHCAGGKTIATALAALCPRAKTGSIDPEILQRLSRLLADSPAITPGLIVA